MNISSKHRVSMAGRSVYTICWRLLKDNEKWRVRDKEAPPKKGSLVNLGDDDDSDDAQKGGRNTGKQDENKKEKVRRKRSAEATTLKD